MRATERVKEVKRWDAETDWGNCGYRGVSPRAAVTMLCLLLTSHSPLSPHTLLHLHHSSRGSSIASAKDLCFCFSSWQLIWIIYISFTLTVADSPLPNDSELGDVWYLFIKVILTGSFFLVVWFPLLHVFSSLVRVKRLLYPRSRSRQLHNFPPGSVSRWYYFARCCRKDNPIAFVLPQSLATTGNKGQFLSKFHKETINITFEN